MVSNIHDYWEALKRLEQGNPIRVSKGYTINNDTVALEAGRKRGSIKKSRESFLELISAVDQASITYKTKSISDKDKLEKEKTKKQNYKELYHQAINRELMLLNKLKNLENQLKQFENIIPFKTNR